MFIKKFWLQISSQSFQNTFSKTFLVFVLNIREPAILDIPKFQNKPREIHSAVKKNK